MVTEQEREQVLEVIAEIGWPRNKGSGMTILIKGIPYDVCVCKDDPEMLEIRRYHDATRV